MVAVAPVHRQRRRPARPDRSTTPPMADEMADAAARARLAALVGSPVVAAEPARWGFSNRTTLATLADGRRVAVQRLTDRAVARRRLRVGERLAERLAAAGVPTAPLLGGDADAATPFALHAFVEGRNGAESLATDAGAVRLARLMGALVPRLAAVDARGLRLPSTWADPARLAGASRRRLERAAARLDAATSGALRAAIASLETAVRRPAAGVRARRFRSGQRARQRTSRSGAARRSRRCSTSSSHAWPTRSSTWPGGVGSSASTTPTAGRRRGRRSSPRPASPTRRSRSPTVSGRSSCCGSSNCWIAPAAAPPPSGPPGSRSRRAGRLGARWAPEEVGPETAHRPISTTVLCGLTR